jgi:peptidoglycan hydrolase-like protein with peptidoglycan-binding domain
LLPWAQACLAQLLGPQVVQDGVMGPNTRQAIQQFQTQGQLPVTGVLDATTVSALQAACSGQQAGAGQDAGPPPPPQAGEQGESERGHGRRWGRGRRYRGWPHYPQFPPFAQDDADDSGQSEYEFESAEPDAPAKTGRWIRRDDKIVLLGI